MKKYFKSKLTETTTYFYCCYSQDGRLRTDRFLASHMRRALESYVFKYDCERDIRRVSTGTGLDLYTYFIRKWKLIKKKEKSLKLTIFKIFFKINF